MSTTAEHIDAAADHTESAEGHEHAHRSDGYYVKIALILAVLTAIETSTYWVDFGPLFMPTLLTMMVIKFLMVVMIFMHLREEKPIYKYLFYSGLLLACFVYLGALATFHFFA
jgi:cytochrome c oxidase subunit IV